MISPNTKNSQSPLKSKLKDHYFGSCTPTTPPPHKSHSTRVLTQPPYAPRGGPSRKMKGDACTPSLEPPIKYASKLETQLALRSLHHTSLYIRLILKAKDQGARTKTVGTAFHSYIQKLPKDGTTILKFLYGHLYTGKLAYRYKLAPTDACPFYGLPDS